VFVRGAEPHHGFGLFFHGLRFHFHGFGEFFHGFDFRLFPALYYLSLSLKRKKEEEKRA
jgi:hypothetical protein